MILEDLKARLPVLVESVKSSKGYLDEKSIWGNLLFILMWLSFDGMQTLERRLKIRESEFRTEMDRLSARLSDI